MHCLKLGDLIKILVESNDNVVHPDKCYADWGLATGSALLKAKQQSIEYGSLLDTD